MHAARYYQLQGASSLLCLLGSKAIAVITQLYIVVLRLLYPYRTVTLDASRCWFVCWGLSYISGGPVVYVLEHLQPGCLLNHVVIFEDDIFCKRGLLDEVTISHLHRLCGVLNQFHIC